MGGIEGWFQYYLSPGSATAQGLKLALRYHFIGLGRVVPYVETTAGAGGTSLKVREIDSTFTFVLEAGVGVSYFVTDTVALNAGYRLQHISNGHTSRPNRGFNSDSGVVGVSFYFTRSTSSEGRIGSADRLALARVAHVGAGRRVR